MKGILPGKELLTYLEPFFIRNTIPRSLACAELECKWQKRPAETWQATGLESRMKISQIFNLLTFWLLFHSLFILRSFL
jgi:hypothetical protein